MRCSVLLGRRGDPARQLDTAAGAGNGPALYGPEARRASPHQLRPRRRLEKPPLRQRRREGRTAAQTWTRKLRRKVRGRYAPSTGLTGLTIVFRSGKATLSALLTDPEEVDCWTGGGKIVLHNPRENEDMSFVINDDGTIETPFGELKKKGN
jgi:hypothetical protein